MEMVKTYPKLSPFQQVLLRGLDEGVLVRGDVTRIKAEGANLTLTTAERFFRASARKESYSYATRIIDAILSYHLGHSADAVQELKHKPITDMVREGVLVLRQLNELPTTNFLPRVKADVSLIDLLVEKVKRLRTTTQETLESLYAEIKERKQLDADIALAEFFIARVGGKVHDFRDELCSDITHAQFIATIYDLEVGPYLTRGILKKIAGRKRPSLEEVEAKLLADTGMIPPELQAHFVQEVGGFLKSKDLKAFFDRKAGIMVFNKDDSGVYYAERNT